MKSALASLGTHPVTGPTLIPIAVRTTRPASRQRGQMTFLTPVETLAVLKVAKQRSTRDWAMILLAYRHGLRASEVCRLKLADIDQKAGSICIRRLKGSLQTVQPLYQHRGQPLLDEMAAVRSWLRKRPADGSNYLFTSQTGEKLARICTYLAAFSRLPCDIIVQLCSDPGTHRVWPQP